MGIPQIDSWIEARRRVSERFDIQRLEHYLSFLEEKNEAGGFFSRGDAERIVERHLLESADFVSVVLDYVTVSRETKVLDAGSGPGLPGFLFACLKKPPLLTLNDSSRRRLSLLEEFAASSRAFDPRTKFAYGRLEELAGRYNLIVSRALIPFPSVLRLVAHLQRPGDTYAGFFSRIDYDLHSRIVQDCGYRATQKVDLESEAGARREAVFFEKERIVRQGKPFAWKFIKSEMSQWQKS